MKGEGHSYLFSGNAPFLEGLYEAYLQNRDAVPEQWRRLFDLFQGTEAEAELPVSRPPQALRETVTTRPRRAAQAELPETPVSKDKQVAVLQLINSYRFLGHRQADLDPLKQHARPPVPELELDYHGLSGSDMNMVFHTGSLRGVPERATLREILNALSTTYCGTIGSEYMHITDTEHKRWIQDRLEVAHGNPPLTPARRKRLLDRLIAGNGLERYLHQKYVGQKRFSLEGGESLIPLLDALIERSARHGIKEFILGMAHRGRLNVLVNIFGKSTKVLFEEFEGLTQPGYGSGDVKYHKGFSSDLITQHGTIHAVLAFNPSHLEAIDPVVEGSVRARQERRGDRRRNQVLPVLIHGDAAFAGQGVVMETLNLSQTRGYTTGGTLHVVINNQIGFTTSDPLDSRSTLYCTDVVKMVQAPILHVNGDDPEAVVFVAELALDYRMRFNQDVVVDVVCFRRHGHSEADEPAATQPIMYRCIHDHPNVKEIYAFQLIEEEVLRHKEVQDMEADYLDRVKHNLAVSAPLDLNPDTTHAVDYSLYTGTHWTAPADTRLSWEPLREAAAKMVRLPEGFHLHPRVTKIVEARRKMGQGNLPMDWGFAELLAYASLLRDGYAVRLSGQDSVRGTFFHRHAAIHDQVSGEVYIPLQHLEPAQPQFLPINSLLSEEAVLGFEVGYSTAEPGSLVIWEAQFGDFTNNAQVMIDQFISSSEAKWQRYCGLVLFLPHGYEGQGPEHSSARPERYLQLCAEDNIQVCVPTTPAQIFHLLRRQVLRPYRKPLVVMTPKSLLRHKLATSHLEDITGGGFQTVIDERDELDPHEVTRLLLCSGKVYYELLEARREQHLKHVAIARIEQQYPFPKDDLTRVLRRYPHAEEVIWTQEEPRNQGAWHFMLARGRLRGCMEPGQRLGYAGRRPSASPAVGYLRKHREQQRALIQEALSTEADVAANKTRSATGG
jgi:2-oxoglutarate dehydrogenase E1 component